MRPETVPDWRAPMLATLTTNGSPTHDGSSNSNSTDSDVWRSATAIGYSCCRAIISPSTTPTPSSSMRSPRSARRALSSMARSSLSREGTRASSGFKADSGITNPEEAWASRIPVSYCLFDLLHLDGCSSSAAAAQQAEAVVQAANDLINRQRPDLCSRRFDGQRHGIEATADLGHGGTMVVGDVKPGRARRAVGKQLDGLVSRRHGRVNDRVVAAGLW